MKAKKLIYIIRFISKGVPEREGEKYSTLSNTYAIVGENKAAIEESIERYRIQENEEVQKFNDVKIVTAAKIVSKTSVLAILSGDRKKNN
jgi:hypothetical protein